MATDKRVHYLKSLASALDNGIHTHEETMRGHFARLLDDGISDQDTDDELIAMGQTLMTMFFTLQRTLDDVLISLERTRLGDTTPSINP